MIPKNSKAICNKCTHKKTCTNPCYPVSRYLYEKGEVYERGAVVFPLHKHVQHSACMQPPEDGKDNVFSDELESPFRNFTPELKQTGIFIHRFFLRDSYGDIAQKFGVSESNARVQYSNAVRKILKNLELLDQDERKDIASIHYKKIFRKKAKAIPKNKKWWIMVNYFGLTPSEVAEIEGTTNRNVSSAICRFDEKVKAGITL